jgi:hypothetical protein
VHYSCPSKILEEVGEFSLLGETDASEQQTIGRTADAFRSGLLPLFPNLEKLLL